MRSAHAIVVLVVVLGLVGGYLVYPRPPELALMHYKNQQYTAARAEYENLLAKGDVSANVVLPLSDLYLIYGEMGKAVELMEGFVEKNPDNLEARLRLSKYYQQTQRPHDYLGSLEKRAEAQPSEEALRHLSQLYNAEGRYRQQIEVLKRIVEDYEAKPSDYLDLAYLLAAEGEMVEAADILRRMARKYPTAFGPRAREFLVSLFLDLGQYEDALTYLQGYGERGGRWTAYYEQALAGAGRYAELFAFWDRQLARSDLSSERKREISYRYEETLRKLGREEKRLAFLRQQLQRSDLDDQLRREFGERYEVALRDNHRWQTLLSYLRDQIERPELTPEEREAFTYRYESLLRKENRKEELFAFWRQQLARSDLGKKERKGIVYRYEAELEKAGRKKELLALLRQRLRDPGLNEKEKRELAYRALELGDKLVAERIFMNLAANESAQSPDVSQLLYIWGPRPEPFGVQWVEERARQAKGKERLAWLERLLDIGATEQVLKMGQQDLVALGYSGEPVEFQMDILQREEDYPRLRLILTRAIEESQDAAQLRRYIRRADQVGFTDLALVASRRLLEIDPDDPDMLRRLGLLAYQEERWDDAYELLGRYLKHSEGDYEANFFYAELLTRKQKTLLAIPYYRRVVQILEREPKLDMRKAVVRAQSLYRVGEHDRALLAFRELLGAHPENRELRADFATVLLEIGEIDQAGEVLAAGGAI